MSTRPVPRAADRDLARFQTLPAQGGLRRRAACDTGGMNGKPPYDPRPLRTLPLHTDSAANNRLYADQRRQLERRAAFIRTQQARDRHPENGGEPLDPVLRCHLGLPPAKE